MPTGDPSAKGESNFWSWASYIQVVFKQHIDWNCRHHDLQIKGMWKNHVTARDHWKHPWDLTWCSDFIQTRNSIGDSTVLWCCLANPSWIISQSNSVLPKNPLQLTNHWNTQQSPSKCLNKSNPQHPIWQGISSSAASVYSQCLLNSILWYPTVYMATWRKVHNKVVHTRICFPTAFTVRAWSLVALYLPNSYEKNIRKDI